MWAKELKSLHSVEDTASGAQRNMQFSSGIHLSWLDTGSWYSCRYPRAPFPKSDGAAEGLPQSVLAADRGVAACSTADSSRYQCLGSSVNPHFRMLIVRLVRKIIDSPF